MWEEGWGRAVPELPERTWRFNKPLTLSALWLLYYVAPSPRRSMQSTSHNISSYSGPNCCRLYRQTPARESTLGSKIEAGKILLWFALFFWYISIKSVANGSQKIKIRRNPDTDCHQQNEAVALLVREPPEVGWGYYLGRGSSHNERDWSGLLTGLCASWNSRLPSLRPAYTQLPLEGMA